MKKIFFVLTLVGIVAFAFSSAAAAVAFDPTTGEGFVGKGDVQDALGWNNAQLQAHAVGVSFSYDSTDTYSAVCTWTTGEGTRGERTHNVSHTRTTGVIGTLVHETRKNSQAQITGFTLLGFDSISTESGSAPVVGGPCPGNQGHDGTWSSVTLTDSGGGGLYANYDSDHVLIWSPAAE